MTEDAPQLDSPRDADFIRDPDERFDAPPPPPPLSQPQTAAALGAAADADVVAIDIEADPNSPTISVGEGESGGFPAIELGSAIVVLSELSHSEANPDSETLPAAPPPPLRRTKSRRFPKIPGYDFLQILGRGGMGVVYAAQQLTLCRLVAVKMISDVHATEDQLRRFHNEAEAIARVQHPNIVQIIDSGDHEGTPYFVMEYVRGGSLAKRLQNQSQPISESARLTEVLALAIQAVHDRGVIHRDVKPSNVLLVGLDTTPIWECVPKLGDFGLAKRFDVNTDRTSTNRILGSPSYIAPEQAQCQHDQVGKHTDVYSLGVILYELLIGRPPFRNENPIQTLQQVINDQPTPPCKLRPEIPEDLETICLKCLEKEPSRRYPTAAALAKDLERFLGDLPIEARPVKWMEKAVRWRRRNHPFSIALALAVTGWVLALAILFGWWWDHYAMQQRFDAILHPTQATIP